MKIRIIGWSNESCSKEGVIFTEDFNEDIDNIVPIGMELMYDEVKDIDLPDLFPLNTYLGK